MGKLFTTHTPKSPRPQSQCSKMTAFFFSTLTLECSTTSTSPSNCLSRQKFPNPKNKVVISTFQWCPIPQAPMNYKLSLSWLMKKIKKLTSSGFSPSKIISLPKTGFKSFKITKTKNCNKPNKRKKTRKRLNNSKSNLLSNNQSTKHGFMIL
jgi:hypothetical protein